MSIGDWIEHPIRSLKNATGIANSPQQPGTGGPTIPDGYTQDEWNGLQENLQWAKDNNRPDMVKVYTDQINAGRASIAAKMVKDPTTGLYTDPTTGKTSTDPYGQSVVTNPNVAQQVAVNNTTGRDILGQLPEYQDQQRTAFGGQQSLAATLNDTIHNPNASSVAQQQLGIGADAAARDQLAIAAGQAGPNAFLARRNAAQNIGASQSALNQAQGLVRADEVAKAESGLGTVLGAEQTGAHGMYDTTGGLATNFAGLAEKGQEAQQGLNQKTNSDNSKDSSGIVGAGFQAAGTILSGGATKPTGYVGSGSSDPGGGLVSDERTKHDIRAESPGSIGELLSSINPSAYEYNGDPRPRHGLVADDIQHSKIGNDLVEERSGLKTIPIDQGLGVALMAVGHLHRRVKALEGGHGRRV